MSNEMETIRLDAGGPYLWNAGDIALKTTTTICERCDDIHLEIRLFPGGVHDEGTSLLKRGAIGLDPWTVKLDPGGGLPEDAEAKLERVFDKYRDEVEARGRRMLRSRDRELWRQSELDGLNAGVLVRYRSLFPADFDLIHLLDDVAYYAEDFHCLIDGCDCGNAAVVLTQLDDDHGAHRDLGSVTLDLTQNPVKLEGKKEPTHLLRALLQKTDLHRRLLERRAQCRMIAPAVAQTVGPKPPQTVTRGPKVGRNAPCPCGSGKKYKKCCL